MRLPWLQIDQDGLNRCRLLARLLGVPDAQGIGIGVSLWQWALEMAPEGDFAGMVPDSGILAAAVSWPIAETERLITELQRVGLVATAPTLRVRGLERYRRAWEKNTRGRRKPATSGACVPETGADPAPVAPKPAPQTQTQIENEKNVRTSAAIEPPTPAPKKHTRRLPIIEPPAEPEPVAPASGPAVYVAPTSEPAAWLAEDFWAWAQSKRQEAGLLGERVQPRGLGAWWSTARMTTSTEDLQAAFRRFAQEPHWAEATPPAPFAGFVKQWDRYVPPRPVLAARADAAVLAELVEHLRGAGANGFVVAQFANLSWAKNRLDDGTSPFIGTSADPWQVDALKRNFGQFLGPAVAVECPNPLPNEGAAA
jgi:hypothetical protein